MSAMPMLGRFAEIGGIDAEIGCASHRDGGDAACTNGTRVTIELVERKLLTELAEEILSAQGIALLEWRVRKHLQSKLEQSSGGAQGTARRSW
jgi:hypothetical protein